MKKPIRQKLANLKNTYVQIAFCMVLLSSFSPSLVSATDKSKTPLTGAVITYLGIQNDNHVVFQVEFENTGGEIFYLNIRNNKGDLLYSQSFKGSKFSKNSCLIKKR